MKIGELLGKVGISRRGLLQGMGAVVAASVTAGCSKDGDTEIYVLPQNDLSFDKAERVVFSSGAFNCGSRCHHKLHVKNGRVTALTSAGDIPREGCSSFDENTGAELGETKQVQYRACARGYTYLQKIYQPDRLKYPLIQTARLPNGRSDKGNINGFKRVTWEAAIEKAAGFFGEAYERAKTLGYVPAGGRQWLYFSMMSRFGAAMGGTPYPCLHFNNNESTGNAEAGKYDSVGNDAQSNNRTDRFNSKFILSWGIDNTSTTYFQVNAYWMETKIREAKGADIVVISSTYSDAAAMLATGSHISYNGWDSVLGTATGPAKDVSIPGWVACRPATDGALMMAMMYVILKRDLHNEDFLRDKCYGFFKNQTVTSISPITGSDDKSPYNGHNRAGHPIVFPSQYIDSDGKVYNFKDSYNGAKFKVEDGDSFQEYLLNKETEWGSGVGDYEGVLEYAARLTGVTPDIIEALAIKFSLWAKPESWANQSEPEAALLEAGGGPQRAYNGMEWVWLCICLSAMCGYSDRKGGGPGFSMYAMTDDLVYSDIAGGAFTRSSCSNDNYSGKSVEVNVSAIGELLMVGSDWRTRERMIDDVKRTTNGAVDLTGREKLIEIDLLVVDYANYIVSEPNSNKIYKAIKENLKHLIVADMHMTPTAMLADVLFPISSHFEDTSFGDSVVVGPTARFLHGAAIDRMYDTRSEEYFADALWKKANEKTGLALPPIIPIAQLKQKEVYDKIEPSSYYKEFVNPDATMPTWDEIVNKKGFVDLTIPKDKPIVGMKDITVPGGAAFDPKKYMDTSTGRINFHSPFLKLRMAEYDTEVDREPGVGCRTYTAKYVPNREGYEKFFEGNDPRNKFTGYKSLDSGETYKLLYLANKPRYRAQTVFDNVAMMKDQVKHHGIRMNAADAAERGIKDGDTVYVYNDRGVIRVMAEVSNRLPAGVVSVEHGVWYRQSRLESAYIWIRNKGKAAVKTLMPVDVGGCANTLTDDCFTLDPVYLCQTLAAQGGPCEVSLQLPINRRA